MHSFPRQGQKQVVFTSISQRMRFTFRNSQIHTEFELFKYVSVGQSATGHRKTSKGKRNYLRQRWQSFVCYTTSRLLQYMQDLEVERILGTVLDLESVAVSSSVWYNILVFLLLEGKKRMLK